MPVTVYGLQIGLYAGACHYNPKELGWLPQASSGIRNALLIAVFGNSVTQAQLLQGTLNTHYVGHRNGAYPGTEVGTTFKEPTSTGDAAPNFKVKSYLSGPAVRPISTSGTATKIAFALTSYGQAPAEEYQLSGISAATASTFVNGFSNDASLPSVDQSTGNQDSKMGDIFMVITLDPGIAVTAGGYLTVKGYAAGVSGSDSFTYITLQTGA